MAQTVGDIAVRVGADTSGLTKGLADADKSLKGFSVSAQATGTAIGMLAAEAVKAAAAIVGSFAKSGFLAVDALDEMAEKSGTSAKSLQSLQLALGEAGVNSDQTQMAIKKLNVAIGEAQSGNQKTTDTFNKLGLSVQELSGMNAEQRFAAIADAVEGYGNAADRAAVSSELFGAKIGPDLASAFAQGGDAIRQASDDIEAMGLAMSDIDAAQVANAMDAFGRAQGVIDGVANKLAVELAPVLQAVSEAFLDAGKEGGGFGGAVSAAVSGAIKVVGFFANAVDGVKRIGVAVSDSLIYGFAMVEETFAKVALGIVKALDMIPGIDLTKNISALEAKVASSQGVMKEAAANMRSQFEKPLAGDVFQDYVAKAKIASEEAAAATIAARQSAAAGDIAAPAEESPEVAKKRAEAEKLAKIEEEKRIAAAEAAALAREEAIAANEAGLMDLENSLLTEKEMLAKQLDEKRNQVLAYNELGIGDKAANMALIEGLEQQHADKVNAIDAKAAEDKKRLDALASAQKVADIQKMFSNLTTLMNTGSRKMFEIGKVAAIANALISARESIVSSYAAGAKIGGPVLGAAFGAAAGLAQFANIQAIRSQSFGGGGGGGAGSSSATTSINAQNTAVQPGAGNGGNQPTQRTNVTLIGDTFGRDQVIGLLNEAFKDGFTLSPT